ncbi:MAG: hypothetical protein P8074_28320 [Anaerolineales bacterium]
MTKQYAFYFDSSSCTGCKACQVACKDKNNLEVGVLWRRVYSVTGGDWVSTGNAWTSQAFAYELSISCNHCQDPLCVHVCPTTAMHKREDGIVLVDASKCIGCKYCEWPQSALAASIVNGFARMARHSTIQVKER